jgi:hypothetical protein
MAARTGLAGLAALLALAGPAAAIPPPEARAYPDPLQAGWKGKPVCVVLNDDCSPFVAHQAAGPGDQYALTRRK